MAACAAAAAAESDAEFAIRLALELQAEDERQRQAQFEADREVAARLAAGGPAPSEQLEADFDLATRLATSDRPAPTGDFELAARLSGQPDSPAQELHRCPSGKTISVGTRVLVHPKVDTPRFQWGSVKPGSVGVVRSGFFPGTCIVAFPQDDGWTAALDELMVADFVGGTCNRCQTALSADPHVPTAWVCDHCHRDFQPGAERWTCPSCDYDQCAVCKKVPAADARPGRRVRCADQRGLISAMQSHPKLQWADYGKILGLAGNQGTVVEEDESDGTCLVRFQSFGIQTWLPTAAISDDRPDWGPTVMRPPVDVADNGRLERLQGNVRTLYHATSRQAADAIKSQGGCMRRGRNPGAAGCGIYFATTKEDAMHKSRNGDDVMLTCRVKLGRMMEVSPGRPDITYSGLLSAGYDSVLITELNGNEHVVYNFDQVEVVSYE